MTATWYQGAAEEFIRKSRAAWEAGAHVVHALSGTSIEFSGSKAAAQTRMMFSLRARVHEVLCDVTCNGWWRIALLGTGSPAMWYCCSG